MKRVSFALLLCGIVIVHPVAAQSLENIDSWPKARVGGKLCLATHEHYGKSPSWPSKGGAQKAAIRAWEAMTVWEYGKKWGSYSRATGKRMSCKKSGNRWTCETTARPCRR